MSKIASSLDIPKNKIKEEEMDVEDISDEDMADDDERNKDKEIVKTIMLKKIQFHHTTSIKKLCLHYAYLSKVNILIFSSC